MLEVFSETGGQSYKISALSKMATTQDSSLGGFSASYLYHLALERWAANSDTGLGLNQRNLVSVVCKLSAEAGTHCGQGESTLLRCLQDGDRARWGVSSWDEHSCVFAIMLRCDSRQRLNDRHLAGGKGERALVCAAAACVQHGTLHVLSRHRVIVGLTLAYVTIFSQMASASYLTRLYSTESSSRPNTTPPLSQRASLEGLCQRVRSRHR
jgi:hypothetical protein